MHGMTIIAELGSYSAIFEEENVMVPVAGALHYPRKLILKMRWL